MNTTDLWQPECLNARPVWIPASLIPFARILRCLQRSANICLTEGTHAICTICALADRPFGVQIARLARVR